MSVLVDDSAWFNIPHVRATVWKSDLFSKDYGCNQDVYASPKDVNASSLFIIMDQILQEDN